MDPNISTIIIAIITGIFGVITLVLQKKQDKTIARIDEQTMIIEKERALRQKIDLKKKELEQVSYNMIVLILDTNLTVFKNTISGSEEVMYEDVCKASESLRNKFNQLQSEIKELEDKYAVVLSISEQYQEELKKQSKK